MQICPFIFKFRRLKSKSSAEIKPLLDLQSRSIIILLVGQKVKTFTTVNITYRDEVVDNGFGVWSHSHQSRGPNHCQAKSIKHLRLGASSFNRGLSSKRPRALAWQGQEIFLARLRAFPVDRENINLWEFEFQGQFFFFAARVKKRGWFVYC